MFRDHTGKISSYRIITLIVVVVFTGVWAYLSILKKEMVIPPQELLVILGALFGGKLYQNHQENNRPPRNHDIEI